MAAIHDVPADFVAAQIDAVLSDLAVDAVKIGMLSRSATVEAVAAALDRWRQAKVVLDPVLIASTGERLLSADALDVLKRVLVPRTLVLTPNLPEASALTGMPLAETESDMRAQAERLLALGAKCVVVKGGHGGGKTSVDLVVDAAGATALALGRVATKNTHGTGCAFSAGIAAGLAKGLSILDSVRAAKNHVHDALAAANRLAVGNGSGPIHSLHAWW